jgi:hypothetical protein
MSFTLGDIIGAVQPAKQKPKPAARAMAGTCPSGKTIYASKADAQAITRHMNHENLGDPMRPYRCAWCQHWHLGHRRGARSA